MSAKKGLFEHFYIWFVIFLLASLNFWLGIPNDKVNIFYLVLSNLLILLLFLSYWLYKLASKIENESFINFLDVPNGKIKFPNIMSFLGEQALGSLLATLTIVYGRQIYNEINEIIAAIFLFLMLLITVTITTLSISRLSLQMINVNYGKNKEILGVLSFFLINCVFLLGGLKLAPQPM